MIKYPNDFVSSQAIVAHCRPTLLLLLLDILPFLLLLLLLLKSSPIDVPPFAAPSVPSSFAAPLKYMEVEGLEDVGALLCSAGVRNGKVGHRELQAVDISLVESTVFQARQAILRYTRAFFKHFPTRELA